jgi:hypothetical protein
MPAADRHRHAPVSGPELRLKPLTVGAARYVKAVRASALGSPGSSRSYVDGTLTMPADDGAGCVITADECTPARLRRRICDAWPRALRLIARSVNRNVGSVTTKLRDPSCVALAPPDLRAEHEPHRELQRTWWDGGFRRPCGSTSTVERTRAPPCGQTRWRSPLTSTAPHSLQACPPASANRTRLGGPVSDLVVLPHATTHVEAGRGPPERDRVAHRDGRATFGTDRTRDGAVGFSRAVSGYRDPADQRAGHPEATEATGGLARRIGRREWAPRDGSGTGRRSRSARSP